MSFSSPLHRGAQHAAQRGRSGRALVAFSVMGSLVLSGAFGVFPLAQTQAAGSEEAPLASVDAPESGVELNEQGFEPIPLEEMSDDPAAPAAQEPEASSSGAAAPTEPAEAAVAESGEGAESEEAADQPQSAETAAEPQMSEFLRAARAPRRAPGSGSSGFATGGSGRFKGDIQWIEWDPQGSYQTVLGNGQVKNDEYGKDVANGPWHNFSTATTTMTRQLGGGARIETTCKLSNPVANKNDSGKNSASSLLKAYTPGGWAGDALDDL